MSNKNYARRTVVKLYFKGADISKELSKYLLSLSFTDKEEDETDDISLSLDDREGKWIKDWLNTSKAVKTKTETVTTGGGEIKVGAIVKFKGGPVYISSMAAEPTVNRGASTCKCTIANHNAHPYHLISQDGQRVYGWCNASDVEGGQATTTTKTTVIKEKKAFKGTEIHAIVIQKNPYSDGKDKVLDCGKFEIDSVSYQGPPQKLTIKATSIPYSTKLRQEKKSKTWENTNLKNIAEKIGKGNSMKVMYLSSHNPSYKRKDIVRIGQVSKVNAGEMTARVQIPDQGIVTGDLRIVKRPPTVECETGCKIKVKPWIPTVGQWVLCIFKPDGEGDGFVIGGI